MLILVEKLFLAKKKIKNNLFVITWIILLGISLGFIYKYAVISNPQDKFKEIKRRFYLDDNSVNLKFEFLKDAYLLKIRHKTIGDQCGEIFFNNRKFSANTWPYKRKRGDFEVNYIHLPKDIVKQGENTISIIFSNNPPQDLYITLRNYRQFESEGIYILFSDSIHLPAGTNFTNILICASILTLLIGIIIYLGGRDNLVGKVKLFLYCRTFLLCPFFILLSLLSIGWLSAAFGYRIVVTSIFFREFSFIVLAIFLSVGAYRILESLPASFSKITDFWFKEKKFDIRIAVAFSLFIIVLNLWVYWPSFFHLFRHDEWFLFFSSKDKIPNLQFIIKHIDWQLKLPYDRLNFRPIFTTGLAINRVLFDRNYIGPHILTFIKHMGVTFLLWFILWRTQRRWISALFALLFSLLITGIDPIMWPHVDAYITTSIFILSAMFIFSLVIDRKTSSKFAFYIISILIFLGILTTQLVLVIPFVFFATYWFVFRKKDKDTLKITNKSVLLFLFTPLFLWAICYLIHLYFAYPFYMTSQSSTVSLWKIPVNIGRFILLTLVCIFAPFVTVPFFSDKVYVNIYAGTFFSIITLFIFAFLRRKDVLRFRNKEVVLPLLMLFFMVALVCSTRATYINSCLSRSRLPSYYTYCINALLIFIIYKVFNFDRIKLNSFVLVVLLYLTFVHGLKAYSAGQEIEEQTQPLKRYFHAVSQFVSHHRKEPDFSFKIIDRPPKIAIFQWYHETCIDGLFSRFINNQKPKYVLEYDYAAEEIKCSIRTEDLQPAIISNQYRNIQEEADYVNCIGMHFKKVSGPEEDTLIGMFEVTQKHWKEVMGFNPSRFKDDSRPVENVSYYMVQKFVKRLNEIEGGDFYRLPTEEEYLYLVRFLLSNLDIENQDISKYAWLKNNSARITHPVGELLPTPSGFYDLMGNVWEWTRNPIHFSLGVKPLVDSPHICFGGSWREKTINIDNLTTSYPLDFRHEHLGFRLVREAKHLK